MAEDNNRSEKNEIFKGENPLPRQPGMPTRNVMKDDFGMEVPVEAVPLPSMGVTYEPGSSLSGVETVEIRAMTAREEDILTSKALIKKGTVISHLLRSCLVDKSIDPDVMLAGDRNAIMTALRITGYGVEYNVEIDCPACSERSKQSFNLAELPIKRLEISPVSSGVNLFEFKLPVSKKAVRFKFLTGHDEQEIMTTMERKKKTGLSGENLVTTRLEHAIVSVDNISDRTKIGMFIKNMPARDSLELRKHIDKSEPGIDMKAWMDCPSCLESSEVRLPMGASFFWPDSER